MGSGYTFVSWLVADICDWRSQAIQKVEISIEVQFEIEIGIESEIGQEAQTAWECAQ